MNIREVAKRAQVSVASVSRTINGVSTVDPEIARRVWKAIDELGYHPNVQARALVSGRSRMLGLIVSDITNPFFPEIIQTFENAAVQGGFEVLLSSTNYDPAKMTGAVRRMLERKVEGVAILTSEMQESLVAQLTGRNVPLAFIDVAPPGERIANIVIDYQQGIQQAVRHLLRLGHRSIGFISGPLSLTSARIRREAFLSCLAENRIHVSPDLVVEGDHRMTGGREAVARLLGAKQPPTAILASNDLTAIGVLMGLDREGLRAPRDISVVGFDDIHLSEFTLPPLTTVRVSREAIARMAYEALVEGLQHDPAKTEPKSYVLETTLIVRSSTGRPPSSAADV